MDQFHLAFRYYAFIEQWSDTLQIRWAVYLMSSTAGPTWMHAVWHFCKL